MSIKLNIFISIIFLLSSPIILSAQKGFSYKLGANYSKFRNIDTEMKPGVTMGLGYEWDLRKNSAIEVEVYYINHKVTVRNKTIAIYWDYDFGHNYNIQLSLGTINLATNFCYYIPICKRFKLQTLIGPSFSLGIIDMSTKKRLNLVRNEQSIIEFDYIYSREGGFSILKTSGLNLNTGIGFVYSFLKIEFRYSHPFYDVETITDINFFEKFDSFHLITSISL